MHLRDVFEPVVEVVVVELQRADCLHLLGAVLVDAQGHDLLVVVGAAVLLALAHRSCNFDYSSTGKRTGKGK